MAIGLVGRKCGMTRIFTDAGESVPVTVVEVLPNRVTQVKSVEHDGYVAVQVTFGARRPQLLSKAAAGHFAKAKVEPGRGLIEFRLNGKDGADLKLGSELKVDLFSEGQAVDVTGVTIGKGYAGVIKRHHFAGGMASHGASLTHRTPGSIGQRQTPGRVFPGKRMSGHMGNARVTQRNLRVLGVDKDENLLVVEGSVPGPQGGYIIITKAKKPPRERRGFAGSATVDPLKAAKRAAKKA